MDTSNPISTALILVGGLGTRLRPLTDTLPKPLLPIKNKPTMQHIIENLARHNVKNIILSIGYKADTIKEYFQTNPIPNINIQYIYEDQPLGTGGAVKAATKELPQTQPFILAWGDNLMDIDWTQMQHLHNNSNTQITMALTAREDVENFGVAKLEKQQHSNNQYSPQRKSSESEDATLWTIQKSNCNSKELVGLQYIIQFIEKPPRNQAPSNLINAGAFIIHPSALTILPDGKSSIEKDCFELLAPKQQITAYNHTGQWFPTDTLEKYYHADQHFQPHINLKEKNIIITDVDDTICETCQQISPQMAEQISKMIKKGYEFAFISGTKNEDLRKMISSRLKEKHHLLATTGTNYDLVEKDKGELKYNFSFSSTEKEEILAALDKVVTHFEIKPMTSTEDQIQDRESQITLSAIGRHAPIDIKKRYDPTGEKRKIWVEFLTQHLNTQKYDLNIGGTTSIDITRKGLTKEWGIRTFLKHNNFHPNQVLFFGDKLHPGGNDYPATKVVDCIAVKNPNDTLEKLKKLCP